MIFLTTGLQLPFDRLVETLDRIAPQIDEEIFGQIGTGRYRPQNFEAVAQLAPAAFEQRFAAARLVVGHAGIGTVLAGKKHCKPLALMARRQALAEHRTDHQIATAQQLQHLEGITIVETGAELLALIRGPQPPALSQNRPATLDRLIAALRDEVFGPKAASHGGAK